MARSVLLLEDEDVIEAGDYVRQLSLIYTGQSDHLATTTTYGGFPINHLEWIEAHRAYPAWVGKTVGEIRKQVLDMWKPHQEVSDYEFIRGPIPESHILPETSREKYLRVYQHYTLKVGKYKGKLAKDVKFYNPSYYNWAVDTGLIPYEVWQSLNQHN